MKLTIFIPAYNEEKRLPQTLERINTVLSSKSITSNFNECEIIVINDSSTDGTVKVAQEGGAIVHSLKGKSNGVGRVIREGIDFILSRRPDVAVGIDADGQFDPNDIPRLVQPILDGKADMVTETKFTDKRNPPAGLTKTKLYGNYVVTGIINWMLESSFTDTSCGYRAYSKDALLYMNIWGDRTYVQEAFIDFYSKGLTIIEVPIVAQYFKDRKSRVFRFGGGVLSYGMRSALILIRALRDYRSFQFFGKIAYNLLMTALFLSALIGIYYFITGGFTPYIFLAFFTAALYVASLLFLVIALLADMIARVKINQEKLLYLWKKAKYYPETSKE